MIFFNFAFLNIFLIVLLQLTFLRRSRPAQQARSARSLSVEAGGRCLGRAWPLNFTYQNANDDDDAENEALTSSASR